MGFGRRRSKKAREKGENAKLVDVEAKALRLLGRRDHGTEELRRKLSDRYYPDEHIETVIERFTELNYLDDDRVIRRMAKGLVRKNWGPLRVRVKLRERGYDDSLIDSVLAELDEQTDWEEHARERLESKYRQSAEDLDRDTMDKAYRHLCYRGFPGSIVRDLLFQ